MTAIPEIIPEERIMDKIYVIRGQKVMLDANLAALYQVPTKRLKEQVRRNMGRFPVSYMFELTEAEYELLRSQNATSKVQRGGTRYLPMVFTEHGVLQLSNVLKSERAEKVSFLIIDVFVKLRTYILDSHEFRKSLEDVAKQTLINSESIEKIVEVLDVLINPGLPPRTPIGFKIE